MLGGIASKVGSVFKIERTFSRAIEDIAKRRRRIRVVVLGSKNSGKTVFLTALASNLINHHHGNGFDLNEWEAYVGKAPKHEDGGIPEFPYRKYREGFAMSKPEWPDKTKDGMTIMRIPLVLKKHGKSDVSVELEFLDLPGERIADLTMVNRSYREWCEWMYDKFAGQYRANKEYLTYLKEARSCQSRAELISHYKNYLREEHKKYSPWVVPSIVKLTKDGIATGFLKELDERPLGLDLGSQFVPVPIDFFDSKDHRKEWVSGFAKAYDMYKAEIVDPMYEWLREADELVYLLDVLNILKGGVEVYNHEQKFSEAILEVFATKKFNVVGGAVLDYLAGIIKTRIKNAFVVVTKRDLALSEDGDKLIKLAEEMIGKNLRGLVNGDSQNCIRTCAAVDTVRMRRTPDGREVPYARTAVDAPETVYQQIRVPDGWPNSDDWREASKLGSYWFYNTWPFFDEREDASPPQIGLDGIVRAMLRNMLN